MIHRPEILILDEPVNGLDPEGIANIREMLIDLAKNEGVSILVSSHLLDEVARIATRIGIIHEGKLLQETSTQNLHKELRARLLVETAQDREAATLLVGLGYNPELHDTYLSSQDPEAIRDPADVATKLVRGGFPPKMLRVEREDLETYFLRIIGSKEAKA